MGKDEHVKRNIENSPSLHHFVLLTLKARVQRNKPCVQLLGCGVSHLSSPNGLGEQGRVERQKVHRSCNSPGFDVIMPLSLPHNLSGTRTKP